MWSGDLVVRDEEGFLYFVGRNDEMIKTSGYRVSPTEIEEVAYDTGMVRDAVALGVDDPKLGQHVVLFVSPVEGKEIDPDGIAGGVQEAGAALHGAAAHRGAAHAAAIAKRQVRQKPSQDRVPVRVINRRER